MEDIPSNPKYNNRWFLVPPGWKNNVDASLLNILSLNRKFIKDQDSQVQTMSVQPPERFVNWLVSSWYNHNIFFSSLYTFLVSLPEDGSITNLQAARIQNILDDMGLIDRLTLLHSLTIKPLLERNHHEGFVPFNSFYVDYPLDHLNFCCGEISLENIIRKYHGSSIELFEQRKHKRILSDIFSSKACTEKRKRLKELRDRMFLNALYDFFIDKPNRIKSLVRISTVDNFDEYRFLYNLEGIEGFYLKDYLARNSLLEKTEHGIESLLNYFAPLKIKMDESPSKIIGFNRLPFYVQSTGVSCASTCAMMVSNLFYKEPVSKEQEKRFHSLMKSDFLEGCPFSKIAYVMSRIYNNLSIKIAHTHPNFFNDLDVEDLLQSKGVRALKEYRYFARQSKLNGVEIEVVKDPLEFVQKTLEQGGIYMAATELDGGVLHSELILGKQHRNFRMYNPLKGEIYTICDNDLVRRMSTMLGKWGIYFCVKDPTGYKDYNSSISWFREKEQELKHYGILNKSGGKK